MSEKAVTPIWQNTHELVGMHILRATENCTFTDETYQLNLNIPSNGFNKSGLHHLCDDVMLVMFYKASELKINIIKYTGSTAEVSPDYIYPISDGIPGKPAARSQAGNIEILFPIGFFNPDDALRIYSFSVDKETLSISPPPPNLSQVGSPAPFVGSYCVSLRSEFVYGDIVAVGYTVNTGTSANIKGYLYGETAVGDALNLGTGYVLDIISLTNSYFVVRWIDGSSVTRLELVHGVGLTFTVVQTIVNSGVVCKIGADVLLVSNTNGGVDTFTRTNDALVETSSTEDIAFVAPFSAIGSGEGGEAILIRDNSQALVYPSCIEPGLPATDKGVYIVGGFTEVNTVIRNRIAYVNSQGVLHTFDVDCGNGYISDVQELNDKIYICGSFTEVNGVARERVACLTKTGELTDWDVSVNGIVNTLVLNSSLGAVFIGGAFTEVNSIARNHIASINISTGALNAWDPGCDNNVAIMRPTWDGALLSVGGPFTQIGGGDRAGGAMVSPYGEPYLHAWNPECNAGSYISSFISYEHEEGTRLVVGGTFISVQGTARNGLAMFTNNVTQWDTLSDWGPSVGGTSFGVLAITIENSKAYIGGGFASVDGLSRDNLARVSLEDGVVDDWHLSCNGQVRDIKVQNSAVYIAGFFTEVGEVVRNNIASITKSGVLTSWGAECNGNVYRLLVDWTPVVPIGGAGPTPIEPEPTGVQGFIVPEESGFHESMLGTYCHAGTGELDWEVGMLPSDYKYYRLTGTDFYIIVEGVWSGSVYWAIVDHEAGSDQWYSFAWSAGSEGDLEPPTSGWEDQFITVNFDITETICE